jgi:hypothetical protein
LSESRDDKEKHFWKVDERIFRLARIQTGVQRFAAVLKSLVSAVLVLLFFAYPLLLVYVGIAYGGMAFWSSLGTSFVIVGIVLWKTGYSRNFHTVDGGMARRLVGLTLAFVSVVGFYLGLLQFKFLMIPIFLGVLGVAMVLFVLRTRL